MSLYTTRGRDNRELVAFAAHVLEQDGEMQLPPPRDDEGVGIGGVSPQGDVALGLALEPLAQLPAGDEPALAPGERRGVDEKVHGQRRLVDLERGSGRGARDGNSVEPMLLVMPLISTNVAPSASTSTRSRLRS